MDTNEFAMVESVLSLFAKVIKQDASQYPHLNNAYMAVAEREQDGKLVHLFQRAGSRRQSSLRVVHQNQLIFQAGNQPFMGMLVRCLHALAPIDFQYSRRVIYHVLDALTSLYDCDDLLLK